MKKTDLAYAAGLFDGEGCITITKQYYKKADGSKSYFHVLRLTVGMTDDWPIQWLADHLAGNISPHKPTNKKYRMQWRWEARGRQAERALRLMMPWLKVKKKQAEFALLFRGTFTNCTKKTLPEMFGLREAFYNRMKTIKQVTVPCQT